MSEELVSQYGLSLGVGGFMLYMLFIIWKLSREAKAGKFGTFVLFLVLSFGMLGFVAKQVLMWVLGGEQ
jgi:ABC-type lipoprotein release transport system permease subunit